MRSQIGNAVPSLGIMPFAFELRRVIESSDVVSHDSSFLEHRDFIDQLIRFKNGDNEAFPFYKAFNEKPVYI